MTPTVYKGIPAIRAAISNWQTTEEDLSIAFRALLEVYDRKDSRLSLNSQQMD